MKMQKLIPAAVLLIFLIHPLICLFPYENTLFNDIGGIEDWNKYARFALDIKHNGAYIPSVEKEYFAPAGFLYNYFLAFCFCVFGENNVPVYILQNLMLAIAVLLVYFSFKERMRNRTQILFLSILILFALLDVAKYYTLRFLSENLSIFLLSAFVFCLGKIEKRVYLLLASFLLGLSVLNRPNLLAFALLFFVALFYFRHKRQISIRILMPIIIFCLTFSSLALRNFYATGNLIFLPAEGMLFMKEVVNDLSLPLLIKKLLFIFGVLSPLDPNLNIRPHWIIMWIFYFIYLFVKFRLKEKIEFPEAIIHLLILSYAGSLLLVAPVINSYGFRLLLPTLLFVLPFEFILIEKLRNKKRSPFLH